MRDRVHPPDDFSGAIGISILDTRLRRVVTKDWPKMKQLAMNLWVVLIENFGGAQISIEIKESPYLFYAMEHLDCLLFKFSGFQHFCVNDTGR